MLKLTRSSKNEIEILIGNQTSRFSPEFWKGVTVALSFHLALFLAFRIAVPLSTDDLPPLRPANVEVDLGKTMMTTATSSRLSLTPLEEDLSPMLPSLPNCHAHPYSGEVSLEDSDFSDLEKIPYKLWRGI